MNILQKLVAGGPGRRTRLHTERNELIPLKELRHLPRVTRDWIWARILKQRPIEPWWPLCVIPVVEEYLASKRCEVIEFGSGSSTIWLAQRAESVDSVEDNAGWAEKTKRRLAELKQGNAKVHYAESESYYALDWCGNKRFDLAIIDGSYRWKCIEAILPLMKREAVIYLDNSDADKDLLLYDEPRMKHEAQKLLADYCDSHSDCRLKRYSGLISGEFHAGEGMILILS